MSNALHEYAKLFEKYAAHGGAGARLAAEDCLSLANEMRIDADAIESENAKLRELVVLQSVIFKHMSTCPTTDCRACLVNEECAESVHLEGLLGIDDKETSWLVQWRSEDTADIRVENAKLRKLVHGLDWCSEELNNVECERCPLYDPADPDLEPKCVRMMWELGIEPTMIEVPEEE